MQNIILILTLLNSGALMYLIKNQKQPPKPLPFKNDYLVVDTSSLIDSRILEIAKTNFLNFKLIIPDFVLQECWT